jgi:hypothetical protein
MPKVLFYAGTVVCLLMSFASAGEVARQISGAAPVTVNVTILAIGLVAGVLLAVLFLRMASLLAARDLFAAFVSVWSITAASLSMAAVLFLEWRIQFAGAVPEDLRFVAIMVLGFFLSLTLLALRPYFSIQASRFLAALVFVPLPLFALVIAQAMLSGGIRTAGSTPLSQVYFSILALLFFSIAVHCIRHRYLFLEMTNLRELMDSRIDPTHPPRPIGGVAFDS